MHEIISDRASHALLIRSACDADWTARLKHTLYGCGSARQAGVISRDGKTVKFDADRFYNSFTNTQPTN